MSDEKKTKQRDPMYIAVRLSKELSTAQDAVLRAKARAAEKDAEYTALLKGLDTHPQEVREIVHRLRQSAK